MMTRALWAKVLVLTVFLAGVVSGAVLVNYYDGRVRGAQNASTTEERRGNPRDRMKRFEDSLSLSPEQRDGMRKILEETRVEFRQLREKTRPEFESIRQRSHDRIRAILNDEQKTKYDEFLESRQRRDRQRHEKNAH